MEKCVYGNEKRSDLSKKILSNVIGSVMALGGISNRGTLEIVVVNWALKDSKRYCEEIVVFLGAFFLRRGNARILQQNNATPHTARHTQIIQNNIDILDWPARSTDLSTTKHV